jgi:hypothetical protein
MKMLKRVSVLMALAVFIAFQGFTQNAASKDAVKAGNTVQTASNPVPGKFVDNNNDGICDNQQAKMKNGKCSQFVDKNGDGVCDNCTGKGQCKGKGNCCGMGKKNGQRKGNCCMKQGTPAAAPANNTNN